MQLFLKMKTKVDFFAQNGVQRPLSRDWVGLKWRSVPKVWEQLQDKHSEQMQNSYR